MFSKNQFKIFKQILWVSIICGIVVCGGFLILLFVNAHKDSRAFILSATRTVTVTKDGFIPTRLIIHQGDTVTFLSATGQPFWPASDPHPTHQIYPEFDSKEAITPNKSWVFTFTKIGEWAYHDHLNSVHHGSIIVLGEKNQLNSVDCNQTANKPQCWEQDIKTALEKKGLSAAFDELALLHASEPEFSANCHGYTHILGQAAYYEFAKNHTIQLSSKTSYCGYGFYHGFMETLLHESGNIQEARDFCKYAQQQLTQQTSKPMIACYHGIGHGAVDGSDRAAWGNIQKIIQPGLDLCEKVGYDDNTKYLCASGVFNALAIYLNAEEFNLRGDPNNPFIYCEQLNKPYFKQGCYEEMNTHAMALAEGDFSKAISYTQLVKDSVYVIIAVENVAAAAAANASQKNYVSFVKVCQSLPSAQKNLCVIGLAGGLLEFGPPGREYIPVVQFCATPQLTDIEQISCYTRLTSSVKFLYPTETFQAVCTLIPKKFENICLK